MLEFKLNLEKDIFELIKASFPVSRQDVELTATPDKKLGDFALTFPFELARKLKISPRQVAETITPFFKRLPGVTEVIIAGPGYINLFIDRRYFIEKAIEEIFDQPVMAEERKIVIEHTNINPNKAAHIGHLRNACLGDSLGRALKFLGEKVEIQNYIDDTGVQVVDVVFGFMDLENKTIQELEKIPGKFDYYCWDLYARVSSFLAENPQAQNRRAEILKKIEHNHGPEKEMASYISRRIVRAHLDTMNRLGIIYDVLPCESSILELKFWQKAFNLLKEKSAIYLSGEGENAGCWVMKFEEEPDREKIIVRSDGTVTYVGKDIAYQLWKFGLLGLDFYYEPFCQDNGHIVWITTSEPKPVTVSFGQASKVINVIDTRQSYLQKIVAQGVKSLGFISQAEKSIHFSYEMVALSPRSLKELDYTPGKEEQDKTFHEVSGRRGLGVKADDLLDKLEEKALAEVEKRNYALTFEEKRKTAQEIATGALRYFMLKFTRNAMIIFDFEDALNFEGETGPYLQYTAVRLESIFRKLKERESITEDEVFSGSDKILNYLELLSPAEAKDFWELVLTASSLDAEVMRSARNLELSHLAKFTFGLCQKANSYYHQYQILAEKNSQIKLLRLLTIAYVKDRLSKALNIMGIPVPDRM